MMATDHRPQSQRGAALVVALILLVVMTLASLMAVRLIAQEEKMVSYAYDKTLSFQAAESALRSVEGMVEEIKPEPVAGAACADFAGATVSVRVCGAPAVDATARWLDDAFDGWATLSAVGNGSLAVTPSYFVEYLGNSFPCGLDASAPTGCRRYRITARAGGNGRAQSMMQSIYATD